MKTQYLVARMTKLGTLCYTEREFGCTFLREYARRYDSKIAAECHAQHLDSSDWSVVTVYETEQTQEAR